MFPDVSYSLANVNFQETPLLLQRNKNETIEDYVERWDELKRSQARCSITKEELMATVWHPRRVERLLETYGWDALE